MTSSNCGVGFLSPQSLTSMLSAQAQPHRLLPAPRLAANQSP